MASVTFPKQGEAIGSRGFGRPKAGREIPQDSSVKRKPAQVFFLLLFLHSIGQEKKISIFIHTHTYIYIIES